MWRHINGLRHEPARPFCSLGRSRKQPWLSACISWVWIKANYSEFYILHCEGLLNQCCETSAHILVKEDDARKFLSMRYTRYLQKCLAEVPSGRKLWKPMFFLINRPWDLTIWIVHGRFIYKNIRDFSVANSRMLVDMCRLFSRLCSAAVQGPTIWIVHGVFI